MGKKWYQTRDFLEERWKWYQKLEAEGFKDIEYHDRRSGDVLPVMKGYTPNDAIRFYSKETAEWYAAMRQWSHVVSARYGEDDWRSVSWAMLADGKTWAEVAAECVKHGWVKPNQKAFVEWYAAERKAMMEARNAEEPEMDPETVGYDVSSRLEHSTRTTQGPARDHGGGMFTYIWDDPSCYEEF